MALDVPLIPINHLEGHLMSPVMEFPEINVPYISLLVSGGHSMIVDVKERGDYEILGQSQDDAVGEAFDKVGKLLGLPYPGGPFIEKIARDGNPKAYDFPRPMIHSDNLDLSFSGLKTSVLYTVRDIVDLNDQIKADIAASFQQAVIDVLSKKIQKSVELTGREEVIIAGGVAANKALRDAIKKLENILNIKVYYPHMKYCGDNAAMIAFVGSLRSDDKISIEASSVRARWPLNELSK
jgi:N6-L-threonylcarbamoyladenine synthase